MRQPALRGRKKHTIQTQEIWPSSSGQALLLVPKIFKLIVDKMYPVSYIKSSLTYLGEEDENTNWMRD